jgi:hypothetical protein
MYFIESNFISRLGFSSQITCIASRECTQSPIKLAVGNRNRGIQVLTFNHKKSIQSLFAVELDMTVPVSLGFVDNPRKDVYVFGLYNGCLCILL